LTGDDDFVRPIPGGGFGGRAVYSRRLTVRSAKCSARRIPRARSRIRDRGLTIARPGRPEAGWACPSRPRAQLVGEGEAPANRLALFAIEVHRATVDRDERAVLVALEAIGECRFRIRRRTAQRADGISSHASNVVCGEIQLQRGGADGRKRCAELEGVAI